MNKRIEINEKNVLRDARELTTRINDSLPARVDPAGLTLKSRIPFSTLSLREVLCHRVAELSSTALNLYETKKKISSYILMRACVETCASIYVLRKKIEVFLKDNDVEAFWSHVRSGLLGSKEEDSKIKAINILTFIDHVDKEYKGFRKMFETLCEFAHPNRRGLLSAYSQYDKKIPGSTSGRR